MISNPTTDGFLQVGPQIGGAGDARYQVTSYSWGAYNDAGASLHIQNTDVEIAPRLFRVFVDTVASEYTLLWSTDGIGWESTAALAYAATSVPADPATIGIGLENSTGGAAADIDLNSLMFRVDETTNMYLPCGALAGA